MLAAKTVSFSMRSPNTVKETSSAARVASKRDRIGEKGGNELSDRRARSFKFGPAGVSKTALNFVWLDGTTIALSSGTRSILGQD